MGKRANNDDIEMSTDNEIKVKQKTKDNYKTLNCTVLKYDNHILDVDFKGCGIRIYNVKEYPGYTALIKYKGEIGQSNFQYKYDE